MNDAAENFAQQGAAFQKIWAESMSRLMQAAGTFSAEAAPPELLRQIRDGILRALSESWNDYLRSAEFQQGMKQWLEQAVSFRKLSNDFLAKARREMQAPACDDIDAVMLAMRHMETRILDRIEELECRMNRRGTGAAAAGEPPAAAEKPAPRPGSPRRRPAGTRTKKS